MSKIITKIKVKNFKRFKELEIDFDETMNVFIGDNEAGKSSILTAIDIVLSGSRNKVENIGLENLFNIDVVKDFLESDKKLEDLPILSIELFLNEQDKPELYGKLNSLKSNFNGLKLVCEPRLDLSREISDILKNKDDNFPFEYYSISFKTFADQSYTGYKKYLRHLLIDNTQINNEYATRTYIKNVFSNYTNETDKNKLQNAYRKYKNDFTEDYLKEVNDKLSDSYAFSIKSGNKFNLDTDLTISEDNIIIENKGKGRQCFIKTKFVLDKQENPLDVVLLEEPENHLSHSNMNRLINEISKSDKKQIFIATHSDLISTRLNLRNAILLNSNSPTKVMLSDLKPDTARFFMKAPDNNILQFILSEKVILVEGDAEYILMEYFFQKITGNLPEDLGVHIISVGGLRFKRYLEIAKLLKIKTAFITDNDGDFNANCSERYKEHISDSIVLFTVEDDKISTFEIALYYENQKLCDGLFHPTKKTVLEYMLSHKANSAFKILEEKINEVNIPTYIIEAIKWISE